MENIFLRCCSIFSAYPSEHIGLSHFQILTHLLELCFNLGKLMSLVVKLAIIVMQRFPVRANDA